MARKPIRVSQLNAYLARLITADAVLSNVAVAGEISNFKAHGSGHVYFSLVDEDSRIDCFLGSGVFRGLDFDPADGVEVVAEGYVNVYEKGGRYSLVIRRLFAAGKGDLAQAFERLKKKLSEKGYFDEGRKKPLPAFPSSIAIVTSKTGAAVQDMIKVITARNSVVDVFVFPALVQGEGAAGEIASRIRQVNRDYPGTDVLIVGRGGGSSEDLWAFNEETVADAIFESAIPVISAVGHETDFTIADFVADRRAETPTAAAIMAAPDTGELREDLEALFAQAKSGASAVLSRKGLQIKANSMEALLGRLKSSLSERGTQGLALMKMMRVSVRNRVEKAEYGLSANGPAVLLDRLKRGKLEKAAYQVGIQGGKLEALNPANVLARGYVIVENMEGIAVTRAAKLTAGQEIKARFSDGRAAASVTEVDMYGE